MVRIVSDIAIVAIAEDVTNAIDSEQQWLSKRWSIGN